MRSLRSTMPASVAITAMYEKKGHQNRYSPTYNVVVHGSNDMSNENGVHAATRGAQLLLRAAVGAQNDARSQAHTCSAS